MRPLGARQMMLLEVLATGATERWAVRDNVREGYIGFGPEAEMKIAASLAKRGLLDVVVEPDPWSYGVFVMNDAGRAFAATRATVMSSLALWRPERFAAYRALVPEVGAQAEMIAGILSKTGGGV